MHRFWRTMLAKMNLGVAFGLSLLVASLMGGVGYVLASSTSNFTLTINPGTLTIDIVDSTSSHATVASPSVAFSAATFAFACQTPGTTGTFGTATEAIYVQNPDAADSGWTASLAASATTATWTSAGTDLDFNDPTTSGCSDGGDADSVSGQMEIDTTGTTVAVGECNSCATTSVTSTNTTASFSEGATDSIDLFSGAAASDDIGDWTLTGVTVDQTIPGEQPAAADYDINMVLSVV